MIRCVLLIALAVVLTLPAGCGSKPEAKPVAAKPAAPKKKTTPAATTPPRETTPATANKKTPSGSTTPKPPGSSFNDLNDKFTMPPEGATEPSSSPPMPGGDLPKPGVLVPVPTTPPAAGGKVVEVSDPITITMPKERAANVLFLEDGRLFTSSDAGAQLWSLNDSANPQTLQIDGKEEMIARVDVSPDGKLLAGAGWEKDIHFWNADGSYSHKIEGGDGYTFSFAYSPQGNYIACGQQSAAFLFDLKSKSVVKEFKNEAGRGLGSIAFSHDDKFLFVMWANKLATYSLPDLKPYKDSVYLSTEEYAGYVNMAVSPASPLFTLSGGTYAPTTDLWNLATWQPKGPLAVERMEVFSNFAFSRDGEWIAAGGTRGDVAIWSTATRAKVARLRGQPEIVNDVAFSHDGRKLAVAGGKKEIRVWSLPELK